VDDGVAPGHRGRHRVRIEHVGGDGLDVRVPVETRRPERVAPEGVEHHDVVVGSETLDQVRADEAGAPGQEDAPSRNSGYRKRNVAHGEEEAVS